MKYIIVTISYLIFLAIIAGAIIYLSRRYAFFFNLNSPKALYITFSAIVVFMIGGLAFFTNQTGWISNVLYSLAAVLLGYTLYLLFSTLLLDLVNLLVKIKPPVIGIISLSLALIICIYGLINAFNIRNTHLEVQIPGLENEIKAVHLSDIHIGHFRDSSFLKKVVKKTNEINPDVVFITGDLFDGKINLSHASLEPFRDLKAPSYFVEGNHDKYSGIAEVKKKLRSVGVVVLENEIAHFKDLQIVGLNHMMADENSKDMHSMGDGKITINKVLSDLPIQKDKPSLMLHHSPDGIKYANEAGIDLFLAGHTHGGQLFPVNILNNYLFPYNKGLHKYESTQIFVSQGIGTFGPPMRIGTNSEVVEIVFK